jgi:MFS family permease
VISPSGYEVGPFLSVEQAALSQIVPDRLRMPVFAWYNLVGSFATAAGALCGGGLTGLLQQAGVIPLNSYRTVLVLYGVMGGLKVIYDILLYRSFRQVKSERANQQCSEKIDS